MPLRSTSHTGEGSTLTTRAHPTTMIPEDDDDDDFMPPMPRCSTSHT
uniref:Uncharacterized protein n=1 Tax=Arundo donax TaxID=35708 RepID=A0A0A9G6K6_ARUDO